MEENIFVIYRKRGELRRFSCFWK